MARILLAEDDQATRQLLARALSGDGHAVTEAEDGASAAQAMTALAGAIDVLVTDVDMPGLDGIALAKQLIGAKPDLKVLLISGFADSLGRVGELSGATVRTLSKPASIEAIRASIREMLG